MGLLPDRGAGNRQSAPPSQEDRDVIEFKPTRYSPPGMTFNYGYGLNTNVGFLPSFFSEDDPRPARAQIDERYSFGGGWHPFRGFAMDADQLVLSYPGDPPKYAVAEAVLRDETIRLYEPGSWVAIIQQDGSYEVSRCD